ncbi:HK97 family phage prohead protease [Phaeovulum vinaykumarii]|nr:HK97 family phage prohead protease [Phaeovulum vinaykumarii]
MTAAQLFEVSAVTVPAYPAAQIEARGWQPVAALAQRLVTHHSNRWRL